MTDARRIMAVALIVPDQDAALGFYVGKLGFACVDDSPAAASDGAAKRWITVAPPGGGARLVLAQARTPAEIAAIGSQAAGRVFLFLSTDDFARDHARMQQLGVTFEEAPRHEPYGMVAVWRDPFGNRWDLIGPASANEPTAEPPMQARDD